jgi:hypothetical protein
VKRGGTWKLRTRLSDGPPARTSFGLRPTPVVGDWNRLGKIPSASTCELGDLVRCRFSAGRAPLGLRAQQVRLLGARFIVGGGCHTDRFMQRGPNHMRSVTGHLNAIDGGTL